MDLSQQEVPLTGLSSRAKAGLREALEGRAVTLQNLQSLTRRDLFMLAGVGRQTLKEIVNWAEGVGLQLRRG